MSEIKFRKWCGLHDFAELEERDQHLICDKQVSYNKKNGEVSGNLEAIEFSGKPRFRGKEIQLNDATWVDWDGPNDGSGTLVVMPKKRAFADMDPVKFTLSGWR